MLASLLRLIYIVAGYLLTPFILLYLLWRSLGNKDYRRRISERFGFYPGSELNDTIWVHAVSVGEVQAAERMVQVLLERYPRRSLLITTTTPTGSDRVRALFGDKVAHSYAPLDLAVSVKRFFSRVRPSLVIILETELWPNLYHECGQRNIPLVLASARVSPHSIGRYRQLVSLFKETLSNGIVIGAQTQADAERFVSLGASPQRAHVTGNIKFDFALPDGVVELGRAVRTLHAADRPVWIAASTHANEEEIALAAHREIREQYPDALLIIVPRHPERFSSVATLLEKQNEAFVKRSSGEVCTAACGVLLGDTMGELTTFYAASDVAFVGGSLAKVGGHNLLEPAALRLPLITGPHTYNAVDIALMFNECGVARVVNNQHELATAVTELLGNEEMRARLGAEGRALIESNRGALDRLLAMLEPLLASGSRS
jgi:3-deoxy-D-manno-octulosonic-acid transferase